MTLRQLAVGAVVVAAYVLAARVGFQFAFVAEQVTTVWAPTGIALASLLIWGRRLWPWIWLGAFLANAGANAPLWTAAAIAGGNTLEAVAAAWVLTRFARFDPGFGRTRDAVSFILVASVASTAISATIGVASLCTSGVEPWNRFAQLWGAWWLGDALGALVVGPAILTVVRCAGRTTREAWIETAAIVVAAAAATDIVFGELFGASTAHPSEYVIFPFLIVAAVRRRQPATALVVLAASSLTTFHTIGGSGPFSGTETHESLVLLQVFMAVVAGTGLVLAAAIAERETGERRRAAAHGVSEVLTAATSLDAAAPEILRVVCERLDWATGAVWVIEGDVIRCLVVHSRSIPASSDFVVTTRRMRFASGEGLPGQVWRRRAAVWIEDVGEDGNFQRAPAARSAGLHGAFAFPIGVSGAIHGVVEFFNHAVLGADVDLLETMSTMGNQIGQFVARKEGEAAATRARREAEAASRAKDEFLATLSHELRTPLNAVIGWTRMLLEGTLDDAGRTRALEVIERNSRLQARLVADILDVSRIISGGLKLDMRAVDGAAVVAAALDVVRPAAAARRITLRSRLEAANPVIYADPQRLQQIVWNIVANAVKFTPEGGNVDVELTDADHRRLQILVRDDGPGIDAAFIPHVFDRFWQADSSLSRDHGGLGLGLAIVRHLVELHGGTVRVESEGRGRGAMFVVVLPRPVENPAPGSGQAG